MTVSSYLNNLAENLVIRGSERESISKSFNTLEARLKSYFGDGITFVLKFGSYHRDTILPRQYDYHSDVDVLIKFSDQSYQPQTYLNKLRRFAEYKYSTSEISQSNPTIILKLNHIKFELVPCIDADWYQPDNYKIPSKASDYEQWILTSPFDFNSKLVNVNGLNNYKIKPLVRILKRWNVNTRFPKIYDSFVLEKKIVNFNYGFYNSTLKDYFYDFVTNMNCYDLQYKYQVDEAKKFIDKIKEIREDEILYPALSERELRKFFE